MNFKIIEGDYSIVSDDEYLKIRHDYMNSKITVAEIRRKYGLTSWNRWLKVRERIMEETGFVRKGGWKR